MERDSLRLNDIINMGPAHSDAPKAMLTGTPRAINGFTSSCDVIRDGANDESIPVMISKL